MERNLLKIEQLIKRFQATDIILFEVLQGIYDVIKSEPEISNVQWNKPRNLESHIASDFIINGGANWNALIANPLIRTYMTSIDERIMLFSWRIDNSTITGSGAGANQLSIKIPSGYKIRGGRKPNDMFCGSGHHFHAGVLETSIVVADDPNTTIVQVYRPALAVWANHTADFITRGNIILPVEKIGAIAEGL